MNGSIHPLEQPRARCRKWQLRVSVGKSPQTGKYQRRTNVFHGGFREAQAALREFIDELEKEMRVADDISLKDYVEIYLREMKESAKYAPRTLYNREYRLGVVTEGIGSVAVRDIKPKMLSKLYRGLRSGDNPSDRHLSGTTVTDVHTALYGVLKQAVKDGIIKNNPADEVDRPKYDTEEKEPLSTKEVESVLEKLDPTKNSELAALLCIKAGLRRGEALALEWNDIDFKRGVISIKRALEESGDDGPPKSKASFRMLPLSESVRNDLAQKKHTGDKVTARRNGCVVKPHSLTTWWRRNRKKFGAPNSTLHILRHTYLTMLAENGVNPKVMQELAGHAEISTTMKIYTHVNMEQKNKAADVMDVAFGKLSGTIHGTIPASNVTDCVKDDLQDE